GKTYSIVLSSDNKKQIFVPKGFAHGFSVLSETAVISYKCDQFYNKQSEAGIRFNDPGLNIDWQIPADKILISEKDEQLPEFDSTMTDFIF
ncbi:MAG TPA: dTDP-4-dehydrorhamnose 3,5-epimerase, partial [Puia sp.]|nr:dTDP-4-dehydrorhamnose 3,5-epimerase [Puia sp.]